jgi:YgiT-type zinc finger domain-containing protein
MPKKLDKVMVMVKQDMCEFCDGNLEHRLIRARFHFHGQTIYVDHVPAWVCSQCGEQYFDAPVYKRLEAIARQRRQIKRRVSFPLAEYDMVLT